MSATELRKAAETLRERAEAATDGPWHARGDKIRATADDALVEDSILVAYATGHDHRLSFKKTGAAVDVEYAATVGPDVGLALAKWLDDIAAGWMWDGEEPGVVDLDGDPLTFEESLDTHALTIARLINGGAS